MQVAIPTQIAEVRSGRRVCREAERYLDGFAGVVEEMLALQEQRFIAIVQEDENADRFDALIFEANEKKQNAKYAYLRHIERHGCS